MKSEQVAAMKKKKFWKRNREEGIVEEGVEGIIEKYDNTSLWNAQGHSTINIANEVGGTAQQ